MNIEISLPTPAAATLTGTVKSVARGGVFVSLAGDGRDAFVPGSLFWPAFRSFVGAGAEDRISPVGRSMEFVLRGFDARHGNQVLALLPRGDREAAAPDVSTRTAPTVDGGAGAGTGAGANEPSTWRMALLVAQAFFRALRPKDAPWPPSLAAGRRDGP